MAPYDAIPFSANDLARRRLESTVDQSLHSLSFATSTLASLPSASSGSVTGSDAPALQQMTIHGDEVSAISSSSTLSSIEYTRAPAIATHPKDGHLGIGRRPPSRQSDNQDTPRQQPATWNSMLSSRPDSPVSTAGHHVSALSLGDGVFARASAAAARRGVVEDKDEFDPERSLGRLVGELGRAMGDKLQPRPASPFSPPRSPRSPSPLPSMLNPSQANRRHHNASLSLTLSKANPLPSPPTSRSSSGSLSHEEVKRPGPAGANGFSGLARQLEQDLRGAGKTHRQMEARSAPTRAILGETTRNNVPLPGHSKGRSKKGAALADLTGMTTLMGTPGRGASFERLGKNGEVGGETDGTVQRALAELQARLRALENENSVSRRRVRELEQELERAKDEVDMAQQRGQVRLREVEGEKTALEDLIRSLRAHLARLTVELEEHKSLVASLRSTQTQTHHATSRPSYLSPPRPIIVDTTVGSSVSVAAELRALKEQVERLGTEVHRLGGIVQEGLDTRRRARGEATIRFEGRESSPEMAAMHDIQLGQDELERASRDVKLRQAKLSHVASGTAREGKTRTEGEAHALIDLDEQTSAPSRLQQGLHQAASGATRGLMPPTDAPFRTRSAPTRPQRPETTDVGVDAPVDEVRRGGGGEEEVGSEMNSPTPASRPSARSLPLGRLSKQDDKLAKSKPHTKSNPTKRVQLDGPSSPFPSIREEDEESFFSSASASPAPLWHGPKAQASRKKASGLLEAGQAGLPPQTVLARVVRELEDDFAHYRSVYAELADSYKLLDPSGATAKRRVLAEHLKGVIDTLEAKAEHIAALYSLLKFKDRADSARSAVATEQEKRDRNKIKSVPDVLKLVRESLGDEVVRRLRADLGC